VYNCFKVQIAKKFPLSFTDNLSLTENLQKKKISGDFSFCRIFHLKSLSAIV